MTKRTPGPQIGHNQPYTPFSIHSLWQPPGATSSGPANLPFNSGEEYSLNSWTPYQRIQVWCIYGIIYCYTPFFLRNPMVMLSGPNYIISTPIPKSITHLEGRLFSHSVLQSMTATRRAFEDLNHLALQELGSYFISGLFKG
ncbi:hypothetical protein O181_009452 [Austropuccinia psidii MF-1]|uniref:Uncharacterized protein n=1 Tax=Austropuccinia psidii MF-1 TaxID=1389203 RepID=A0A9Q3GKB8_9BASI|nr:hypothetical protein [Austropuccinia psidii MF-1]